VTEARVTILVYSDDRLVRQRVKASLGRRPDPELPRVRVVEAATHAAVLKHLDAGGVDVAILDGEAVPSGGMGLCRQLKDEIFHAPPVLLLLGRAQDRWLATWSRADAVAHHPIDAMEVARETARLMRQRLAHA
jgi:DNA-binding response OmpR family regulator